MKCEGKGTVSGLAIALAVTAVALGACGSDDDRESAGGSLPADTAEELAAMSDGIADALDAGDTCDAAQKADDLQAAVSKAEIPGEIRSEVEAGADQLVNQVNCDEDSTGETTTTETTEEPSEDEEKGDEGSEDSEEGSSGDGDGDGDGGGGPPGQDPGFTPPGQQGKIKGGI